MAEAKKCDRCGKFYVYNKHEFKGCNIRHRTDTTQSIYFDLCDECIVKLWNFLTPPVETDDAVDHYNQSKDDVKRSDDTSTLDTIKMSGESSSSL